MANEPGISTSIVTDNSSFDRSMKVSVASLESLERRLAAAQRRAASSGVQLSKFSRVVNQQAGDAATLEIQLARLENEYLDVGNAASRTAQRVTQTARGFRLFRGQLYNASIQLQDFAVQTAAGTSALVALSQNAPQFMSFLGPKWALIGAFTAALPLMVTGLSYLTGGFKDFDKTLEDGQSALDAYIKSMEALNSSFGGAYEGLMEQINATSVATADLARIHEQRAVAAVKAFAGALADSNTEVSLWRKLTGKTDIGLVGDLLEIETKLQGSIGIFKENREEVRQFIEAVRSIDDAGSIDQMYEAALRAREIFVQNVDITGEMTAAQQQFLEQLALTLQMLEQMGAAQQAAAGTDPTLGGRVAGQAQLVEYAEMFLAAQQRIREENGKLLADQVALEQRVRLTHDAYIPLTSAQQAFQTQIQNSVDRFTDLVTTSTKLKGEIGDAAFEALRLAGVDIVSGVDAAAKSAAQLAANMGISLAAALELQALGATPDNKFMQLYNSGAFGGTPNVSGYRNPEYANILDRINNPAAYTKGRAGGGRRGGGAAAVDPFKSKLEQLRNSLMTEEELERQSYQTRTELLEEFLKRQPEKIAEYQDLVERLQEQHHKRMAEIDVYKYGTSLQKAETFFGEMATALQSGNEKMLRIAKVFGAAEALVNSWRAYAQVIGDPTVPWFAKLAKATAVLSAGIGAVQAIKGVSPGGSTSGGRGAAAGGGAAAAPAIPTQTVSINLQGDTFSRATVEGLLEQIQSQLDRGGRLVFS